MPQIDFSLADDHDSVVLEIDPESISSITTELIVEAFQASEFSNFYLNQELLPGLLNQPDPTAEPPPPLIIANRRDATLEIIIAQDAMTATARITGEYGGKKIKAQSILIGASKKGITHGLAMNSITDLASRSRKSAPGTIIEAVIAEGTPPIDGIDGYLEKIAWTLKDRILTPQKIGDGTGTVDMRKLGPIVSCKPEDPLMRRHPPKPGEYGTDVTGKAIAFNAGADPRLKVGEGSKISDDDPDLLIAMRKGLPRVIDDGMTVDEVLELKRVDLSSGDIEYDGSILIEENVAEDMLVKANGDISIGGIVESAVIEAQGDIFVGNGIIGRQLSEDRAEHSVKLTAKESIYAKYAQNADLKSGQDIVLKEYLFNSSSHAGNDIWVGQEEKADGHMMGGSAIAGKSITAGFIGAESGSSAQIELAPQIKPLRSELRELAAELLKQQETLLPLRLAMQSAQHNKQQKREHFKQAKQMLLEQQQRVNECESALNAKQATHDACIDQAALVAQQKLYSLIQIRIFNKNIITRREHGPVRVVLQESELLIDPLTE